MGAADGARWNRAVMRGYGLVSIVLIGLYPFLSGPVGGFGILVALVGAAACVAHGLRAVASGRRAPWILVLASFAVFVIANLVLAIPAERAATVGRLIDAMGYVLLLAAAVAFIFRRRLTDVGGVIDAAVIALAAGGFLWAVLPHRLGPEDHFAAQLELFLVLFALTGVLGALLRLARIVAETDAALRWLLAALALVITGDIVSSLAGSSWAGNVAATMLLMSATTAIGLFGLDRTGPRLVDTKSEVGERLSGGRLAFFGIAVAFTPLVAGIGDLVGRAANGLLIAVQGIVVAALVMTRVALLSAQQNRAQQALAHQATRDPLTHLLNRREFVVRLRDELGQGRRCTLLFCDLDEFKLINDRFGHGAGDELLLEVSSRMLACAGPRHVVSRLGGDEFVVLVMDATPVEEEDIRGCIVDALQRPIERAGVGGIGVSVGIASADGERDPEWLIRSADRAMYQVKMSHKRAGDASK